MVHSQIRRQKGRRVVSFDPTPIYDELVRQRGGLPTADWDQVMRGIKQYPQSPQGQYSPVTPTELSVPRGDDTIRWKRVTTGDEALSAAAPSSRRPLGRPPGMAAGLTSAQALTPVQAPTPSPVTPPPTPQQQPTPNEGIAATTPLPIYPEEPRTGNETESWFTNQSRTDPMASGQAVWGNVPDNE